MKDPISLKPAIQCQHPRFAIVRNAKGNPIAVEASLDEVIADLVAGMRRGLMLYQPFAKTAKGKFSGIHIIMTEQPKGGEEAPTAIEVQIFTDLADTVAATDQMAIGAALQAIAVSEFRDETKVKAETAVAGAIKEAESSILKFPEQKA